MGLFDKLFNDEERQKEEAARRKAAERYAESRSHTHEAGEAEAHAHTETRAHTETHAHAETHAAAPAKKSTAKPAAKAEPERAEAKPAAKKTAAKKAGAAKAAVPRQEPRSTIHHQGQATAGAVTVAHDQAMTIHLLSHIPDHAPRESDPHYHLFEQAKARLKRQGLWKCIIDDDLCDGVPELHHTYIEFSQINEVDPKKVEKALGLHFENDEEFQDWAESPGNLEVLCTAHHRAHYGIHVVPGPLWEALRFRKSGTEAAAEVLTADEYAQQQKQKADE